jgi:predicted RNA polymerase sigma factor
MLLIHQGDTPTPGMPEWERLSADEQQAVYQDYQAINETPEHLDLEGYHYLHATRAELLRRLDRVDEARAAYDRALELVASDAERCFLERRLAELP